MYLSFVKVSSACHLAHLPLLAEDLTQEIFLAATQLSPEARDVLIRVSDLPQEAQLQIRKALRDLPAAAEAKQPQQDDRQRGLEECQEIAKRGGDWYYKGTWFEVTEQPWCKNAGPKAWMMCLRCVLCGRRAGTGAGTGDNPIKQALDKRWRKQGNGNWKSARCPECWDR